MTAPGPSKGDRIGMAQMSEITTRPITLEASGERVWAITFPMPVKRMIPISMLMKAMNGKILRITCSIVSRPDW